MSLRLHGEHISGILSFRALALCVILLIAGSYDVLAEDPPSKDHVPSTLLVDFLNARSYTAAVMECRDQDYPVFGVDVKVYNLGPKINSGYSDYNPVLDKKESFMLFTSRRNIENGEVKDVDGQYYEKMMVSRRKNGVFQEAVPITQNDSLFGRLPSSERHESLIFLSYSEDLLITYTDEKLFYSNRIGDFYTEPVEFPKIINKGKWKRHASITEDGRKLYFTTESQSSVNKNLNLDIWEIERKDDGSWKRPKRISDVVNSPYNEDSPEISPDGRFIFFSSNRFGGMGGYDVYMAENVDGEWQEPKNLCQPINTPGDDIYFKLSRNGNYAYYSSNALGGQGNMDVYKVVLDVPSIATCASYAYGRRTINYTSPFEIDFYGPNKEFFWAFGDGQTGVGASINHEYAADGDYQVVLYVRDKASQRIVNTVFSKLVRVDTENSSVDILGPDTAELGHEFHFDGTDSYVEGAPATAYYWKIDGQLVSREPEINYEFTRVGTHKVELEVGVLDERVMELSSACIAREVEVITPFEYSRTVGASQGSEGFSYSNIIPDQVLFDMGVKQNENALDLENDYIKLWQDESKSFSAFENDRSPGISLDKLIDVSKPMHGTVKVKNANYGLLVYEPRSDFFGYDKFNYTVRSKTGQIANATVVVSVMQRVSEMKGQNVTNDEVEIGTAEESVKIFPLQNDQHDLGSNQRIVDLSQPSNGTVQQLGLQGLLEYSPTASFQGSDAFTYTVQDEEGGQSTASVIIRSKDITKTKLYANPDYIEIKQGEKARVKVLENDVYKGKVSITSVGVPKHGSTRVINPLSGDIFYGPDNDFVGTDAFTYTLEDAEGRRTATSVTVVVTENIVTNKPLVLETPQGTPVNAFIFEEFNIPAGYELSGKVHAKNGKAQVIDSKKGIVNYAPNEDFAGFEMFYVGVEKDGESLELGVIVKVKAVQSLMEKYGISTNTLFINVNGRTIIDVRKFAYSKLTEDQMMIAIREAFDAAELIDESQIGFSYNSLEKEQYAITYQVQDDEGNLFAGSIVINPVDELGIPIITKMVLVQDVVKTRTNTPLTVLPMLNDRHLKGRSMKIVDVTTPMNGTVVMNGVEGSVLYIPNLDFHGTDAFTYTVQDEAGVKSTSAVSIVVLNQVEFALEARGYNPNLKAFDYVALAADEQSFKPEKIIDATNGLFGMVDVVNAYTGEVKYTPNQGFAGEDRFSFTMQHTDGSASSHSVLAVVDERNEFIDGTRQIEGRVVLYTDEVMYHYGLFNKIHPEGKAMKIVAVQSERKGTTDIIDQAAFAYRPIDGFKGMDKLTFTVMDEDGNLQKNEVFIEVKDKTARMDLATVNFETPVNLPLELSLKGEAANVIYHDHTQPESGQLKLISRENLSFRYDAKAEGDVEKFRVALKSIANNLIYIDVVIDVKPAVDLAIDAPSMGDFEYQVEKDPNAKLLSATQGRKGEVKYDPMTGSISYDPYAAAVGMDFISYITEMSDGAIAQEKIQILHVEHKKFTPKQDKYVETEVASNAPVLIYAFSNMNAKDLAGTVLAKIKGADEGEVRILDAERGIIEFTPKEGTVADEFSYRLENAKGEKQEVTVSLKIKESKSLQQQVLTITAAKDFKTFNYRVLDYLEQNKLTYMSVSDGAFDPSFVEVLDAESGVFSYMPDAPVGTEDILIVEAMDEEGNVVQIPVKIQVVDSKAYSAANLTYNNISSVESNKDSYHTVLGRNEKGYTLIRASNAKAGSVRVMNAAQGIVRYSPYPGFIGEDSYVFEYVDGDGNIFQKEMEVVVRDESAGVISISEIERQSQQIAEKVTNLTEDLALAQQESIANLPSESDEEIQRAIAASKEQERVEAERRRAKKLEDERLAKLEEEKRAQESEEARIAALQAENEAAQVDASAAEELALALKEKELQEKQKEKELEDKHNAEEQAKIEAAEKARAASEAERLRKEELAAQQAKQEATSPKEENVVFRNILFDFDKSDLRPLSIEELNKILAFMQDNPDYELQLDGHADWIGTVEYNLALSERRAKQAYEYLTQKGIPDARMVYQFYGEAIPVAPNTNADGTDNPEGRQLNRRCEFEVKESGTASNIKLKF